MTNGRTVDQSQTSSGGWAVRIRKGCTTKDKPRRGGGGGVGFPLKVQLES